MTCIILCIFHCLHYYYYNYLYEIIHEIITYIHIYLHYEFLFFQLDTEFIRLLYYQVNLLDIFIDHSNAHSNISFS
jgi:hypothetical protein